MHKYLKVKGSQQMLSSKRELGLDKGGWIAILIYFRTLAMATMVYYKSNICIGFQIFFTVTFYSKISCLKSL